MTWTVWGGRGNTHTHTRPPSTYQSERFESEQMFESEKKIDEGPTPFHTPTHLSREIRIEKPNQTIHKSLQKFGQPNDVIVSEKDGREIEDERESACV